MELRLNHRQWVAAMFLTAWAALAPPACAAADAVHLAHRDLQTAATAVTPAPATTALQCGAGEWYDEKALEPECVTCAKRTWCPRRRIDASECREGHTGFACDECLEGCYFDARERCQACPPASTIALAWAFTAFACALVLKEIYRNARGWMDSAAVTIVTTHFQLTHLYFSFGFVFPEVIQSFLATPLGVFNGFGFLMGSVEGWAAPRCLGLASLPFTLKWLGEMAVPFLFMAPFAAMFASAEAQKQRWREADEAKAPSERVLSVAEYEERKKSRLHGKRAMQSILLIMISATMSGIRSSVNVWTCLEYADGTGRLSVDPTVICEWSDPTYGSLVVCSVFVFVVYFFAHSGLVWAIIASEEGRRLAAEHHITHARLLRDATYWSQLRFAKNLFVQGPSYGGKMELRRLFRRLRASNLLPVAVMRLKDLTRQSGPERAAFAADKTATRLALKKAKKLHLPAPRPDPSFFLDVYPLFVRDKTTGNWVRGIVQRVDPDTDLPVVAVGEGAFRTVQTYEVARMDFEDKRPVAITTNLLAWQQQEHDSDNAMAGAPIGEFGRIALRNDARNAETKAFGGGVPVTEEKLLGLNKLDVDDVFSKEAHVNISLSRMAMFVFHLDLTEPMGFAVRERLGRLYVRDVDPSGQGALAGLSSLCAVARIGGKPVRTREEFLLALVKRRIVSAELRRGELEKLEAGDASAVPTVPLSGEDRALLAAVDAGAIRISPVERGELVGEIQDVEGGMLAHCSVTYTDSSFSNCRRLPYDFSSFIKIAKFKPEEPYWEMYGFILSRFKFSTRHYDAWANVRKVAAVLVRVTLAPFETVVQATAMICICTVALVLQVRLQPYDDMNIMNELNSADAVISNNTLEMALLVLQISQLSFGMLTLFADLPEWLVAVVYIAIVAAGLGLSFVALSTKFAKSVHGMQQVVAPYAAVVLGYLGLGEEEAAGSGALAKRRQTARLKALGGKGGAEAAEAAASAAEQVSRLLDIASTYEAAPAAAAAAAADSSKTRVDVFNVDSYKMQQKRIIQEHRAAVLAEKQALHKAKDAWVERRNEVGQGGHLTTAADDVGRLDVKTEGTIRAEEGRIAHQKALHEHTKDFELNKGKLEWLARQDEGGVTVAEDLGHFGAKSAGAVHRDEDTIAHRKELLESTKDFALQAGKAEWQARRDAEGDAGHTVADKLGHFSELTASEVLRRKADERHREEKAAGARKAEAEKAAWLARTQKDHPAGGAHDPAEDAAAREALHAQVLKDREARKKKHAPKAPREADAAEAERARATAAFEEHRAAQQAKREAAEAEAQASAEAAAAGGGRGRGLRGWLRGRLQGGATTSGSIDKGGGGSKGSSFDGKGDFQGGKGDAASGGGSGGGGGEGIALAALVDRREPVRESQAFGGLGASVDLELMGRHEPVRESQAFGGLGRERTASAASVVTAGEIAGARAALRLQQEAAKREMIRLQMKERREVEHKHISKADREAAEAEAERQLVKAAFAKRVEAKRLEALREAEEAEKAAAKAGPRWFAPWRPKVDPTTENLIPGAAGAKGGSFSKQPAAGAGKTGVAAPPSPTVLGKGGKGGMLGGKGGGKGGKGAAPSATLPRSKSLSAASGSAPSAEAAGGKRPPARTVSSGASDRNIGKNRKPIGTAI